MEEEDQPLQPSIKLTMNFLIDFPKETLDLLPFSLLGWLREINTLKNIEASGFKKDLMS
jgi:hypothetical protein